MYKDNTFTWYERIFVAVGDAGCSYQSLEERTWGFDDKGWSDFQYTPCTLGLDDVMLMNTELRNDVIEPKPKKTLVRVAFRWRQPVAQIELRSLSQAEVICGNKAE